MTGPRSQNPWQPVVWRRTLSESFLLRISAMKASRTGALPRARQPVSPSDMQGSCRSGALRRRSFRANSSSADLIRSTCLGLPFDALVQNAVHPVGLHAAVVVVVDDQEGGESAVSQARD